jgi:hypothetical protein
LEFLVEALKNHIEITWPDGAEDGKPERSDNYFIEMKIK